jgi:Rad3-related DNA helicase
MAFKTTTFAPTAAVNPAAHFKTLTKRQFPDVMPHQKEMLEAYAAECEGAGDAALQLPTGSGKTLVGLLIADWRRIKHGDRAVYLCPTRQLVRQTLIQAQQYGIDVVDLSGPKDSFAPSDRTAYLTGAQIAISTYSGLFNTHPFFENPDVIVIDDAHAAENYIAKMWSLEIAANTPLHGALAEYLKPHLDLQSYSRLTGDWMGSADATWIEKLPTPQVSALTQDLVSIIDAHATRQSPDLHFPWSLIRDHVDACHVYLGSREILIRPLIPPTYSHAPFANAKQRLYMSATLGAGGDLERLTGRENITRLAAPDGFQSSGVGRRFFMFPSLSLSGEDTDALRLAMQQEAGRSVVLTPSSASAEAHAQQVSDTLNRVSSFAKWP